MRRLDMAISMLYSKSALKKIPGIDCLLNIRTLKSHLLNRTRYNEIEGSVVSNYIEKASIYDDLKDNMQPLVHWYYGHFHQSWSMNIDGCHFHMLDINQLQEIR